MSVKTALDHDPQFPASRVKIEASWDDSGEEQSYRSLLNILFAQPIEEVPSPAVNLPLAG